MSPHERKDIRVEQKDLQRVSVISSCAKGEMACARAAELLLLSVRQVKRLKKRLREQGEAALAHANRGRPGAPGVCRSRCGKLPFISPVPRMPASTITTSAKD